MDNHHDNKSNRQNKRLSNLQKINQNNYQIINILNQSSINQEEQQSTINNKILQYQVEKAQLTGIHFEVLYAAARHFLPGTYSQKQQSIRKLILQFIKDKTGLDLINGNFCPRLDIGLSSNPGQIYQTRFILFGVDVLTTKKILNRYGKHNPNIKWIDASHCLLQFSSVEGSKEFVLSQVIDFRQQDIIPWEQNPNILARDWVQLNCYIELVFIRRLFVRNLTESDQYYIKNRLQPQEMFGNYKQARNDLQNLLMKDTRVKQIVDRCDQQQRHSRTSDPNYKNLMRKKRIQQKKIEGLIQQSQKGRSNQENLMVDSRSRSRDLNKNNRNQRHNRQQNHLDRKNKKTNRKQPSNSMKQKINAVRQQIYKKIDNQINQNFNINQQQNDRQNVSQNLYSQFTLNPSQKLSQIKNIQRGNNLQQDQISDKNNDHLSISIVNSHSQSSNYRQINSQINRFHINSDQYSSIFEKSQHNLSQGNSQFSNSNPSQIQNSNNEQHLSNSFNSQGIQKIEHNDPYGQIRQQSDDEIIDIIQNKDTKKQPQQIYDDEVFRITSKPLSINQYTYQQVKKEQTKQIRKIPKKKN